MWTGKQLCTGHLQHNAITTEWDWCCCDKWVPDTTAWCILRLWMDELSQIWKVAANILN